MVIVRSVPSRRHEFCPAEAVLGLEPNDKVVTGMDIPTGCIFKNYNANLFHALSLGKSMGDLKVSVSKGKNVATLLDADFPTLLCEGDQGLDPC